MIYPPSEDSFLLEKEVINYLTSLKNKKTELKNLKVIDMGTGSGIQAKACLNSGIKRENILCADLNKEAINLLNKEKKLKAIQSNLFSNISKKKKFDLIIFNAPYLPEDEKGYDKGIDTTSGKEGNEIIIDFLKQSKSYLDKKGVIFLLFSNLSKPESIIYFSKKAGYKNKKISEKNMGFFEKIYVYMFSLL